MGRDESNGELADLTRRLIKTIGLPLKKLGEEINYSKQSLSAWQRGERAIPPQAMVTLLRRAHATARQVAAAQHLMGIEDLKHPAHAGLPDPQAVSTLHDVHEGSTPPPHETVPLQPATYWTPSRKRAAVALVFMTALLSVNSTPGAGSPERRCAFVIKEPAGVYPAPDANSQPIKFKVINDGVEVLDRPHPPGWTVVRTPRNPPGLNWMQTDVLNDPRPSTQPCPLRSLGSDQTSATHQSPVTTWELVYSASSFTMTADPCSISNANPDVGRTVADLDKRLVRHVSHSGDVGAFGPTHDLAYYPVCPNGKPVLRFYHGYATGIAYAATPEQCGPIPAKPASVFTTPTAGWTICANTDQDSIAILRVRSFTADSREITLSASLWRHQ